MRTPSGKRNLRRSLAQAVLAALVATTSLVLASAAPARAAAGAEEQDFLNQTNAVRAQNGLGPLQWDDATANIARWWSSQMSAQQTLFHNPNLVSQISSL